MFIRRLMITLSVIVGMIVLMAINVGIMFIVFEFIEVSIWIAEIVFSGAVLFALYLFCYWLFYEPYREWVKNN